MSALADPCSNAATVTPSDDVTFSPPTRCLWVATAGDVAVLTVGGQTVTIPAVPAGTVVPLRVTKVMATNTTPGIVVQRWW